MKKSLCVQYVHKKKFRLISKLNFPPFCNLLMHGECTCDKSFILYQSPKVMKNALAHPEKKVKHFPIRFISFFVESFCIKGLKCVPSAQCKGNNSNWKLCEKWAKCHANNASFPPINRSFCHDWISNPLAFPCQILDSTSYITQVEAFIMLGLHISSLGISDNRENFFSFLALLYFPLDNEKQMRFSNKKTHLCLVDHLLPKRQKKRKITLLSNFLKTLKNELKIANYLMVWNKLKL